MIRQTLALLPDYPAFPLPTLLGVAWAVIGGKKRSFRQDAMDCTRKLQMRILNPENMPQKGPGVVLVNHYYRPGFFAGWIALAVSAAVPVELVWMMTAAWTEGSTPWEWVKARCSVSLFPRLARVYSFIPMPPMPPRAHEVAARARAVRQFLAATRQMPPPVLAVAPEGMDPLGGQLMQPHRGVGRMLAKLAARGLRFYPVGVFEQDKALILHFGPVFQLSLSAGLGAEKIDQEAADSAMCAIAACLPSALRGAYR
jgi:hypothetical protein